MLLSDAIALGRVLMNGTEPHSFCGCALAMGLLGAGKEPCARIVENIFEDGCAQRASQEWNTAQVKEWPWIEGDQLIPYKLIDCNFDGFNTLPAVTIISDLFFEVERGAITLDQLIDWVRSVEPPEQPEQPLAEPLPEQAKVEVKR